MLDTLLSFAISLLIGLVIGLEREHSHKEGMQAIGVRTFILIALLGTIAATLNQPALTITISLFVFTIIVLGYIRSTKKIGKIIDVGITTETSAAIVFCIGYLIPSANLIAITISAFVLLILVERERLHIFARKKFKPHEIETTIILVIFALGILPILPHHTIDPWGLFNPWNFGVLIVTIASIQFMGYIAIRLFGERFGIAITGFLGGLVSSTAVFANLSITFKSHPKFKNAIVASAILATLAMLVEIIAIILVASPTLLYFIIKPLLMMIVVSTITVILLMHYQKEKGHTITSPKNPLNLRSLLQTSIFIGFTLILIALAERFIGTEGILIISFLGALFEIHGITLATSLLYLDKNLTSQTACYVLYTAIIASFVSKLFLLFTLTPARFAFQASAYLLIILLSGGLTYWLL